MDISLDEREIYIICQALGDFIESTSDLSEHYHNSVNGLYEYYGELSLDAQNLLDKINLLNS